MLNSNDTTNLVASYVLIVNGKVRLSSTSLANVAFIITSDCMDAETGILKKSANSVYNHAFDFVENNNLSQLEADLQYKNIAIYNDVIVVKSLINQGVA